MGTDIHYSFEKKNKDNRWEVIETDIHIYRNYLLFAVLANVRNRWTDLEYISEPRGLPDDILLQDELDRGLDLISYYYGDHSYSWLTSSEIFDWFTKEHIIKDSGIVNVTDYLNWDGVTPFTSYCQGIGGPNIKLYDDVRGIFKLFDFKEFKDVTHVRAYWNEDVNKSLQNFKERIETLVRVHGELRFVFGFDS